MRRSPLRCILCTGFVCVSLVLIVVVESPSQFMTVAKSTSLAHDTSTLVPHAHAAAPRRTALVMSDNRDLQDSYSKIRNTTGYHSLAAAINFLYAKNGDTTLLINRITLNKTTTLAIGANVSLRLGTIPSYSVRVITSGYESFERRLGASSCPLGWPRGTKGMAGLCTLIVI